jgi:hypothetical protein
VVSTFNTCSRGPTHRSLTDTGGATTLEVSAFHVPLPRPSQQTVLHFPRKYPARSQVIQNLPKIPSLRFKEPMAVLWSSDHPTIYRDLQLCLAIANELSLAIGLTRIERKIILIQLGYQSNSYNLMHNQELEIKIKF